MAEVASCSPSLSSASPILISEENDRKKKWIRMNKNPNPPNLDTTGLSRWGARAGKSTLAEQLLVARRFFRATTRTKED
jgi:hypothetical protein